MVIGCDTVDRATPFSVLGTGLLDEPAHLATAGLALLVLSGLITAPRSFYVAALVASVAIDLDHVPLYWGMPDVAVAPHGRPFTHSLATVVVLLLVAAAPLRLIRTHRAVILGVVVGLCLHFTRDIVEGRPGVALFWPVSRHEFIGNWYEFLAMVLVLLLISLVMPRRQRVTSKTRESGEAHGRL